METKQSAPKYCQDYVCLEEKLRAILNLSVSMRKCGFLDCEAEKMVKEALKINKLN